MANPQKENGYTAIANDILNAFRRTRIPGEARQVLDCIIRQTYGFNKKTDTIALAQFVEWTGMKKPEVCRALAKLQTMNIIVGEKANSRNIATKYSLNKNYDKWVLLAKKPTTIGEKANSKVKKPLQNIEVPLAKKPPSKDNTKDTIQKTSKTPTEFLLGEQWNNLIDPFAKVNPMYLSFYKSKTERRALSDMAKEIGYEKLKWLIENLKGIVSKPYAPKVSKPTELRRDLGKVIIFLQQEKNKDIKNKPTVGKI